MNQRFITSDKLAMKYEALSATDFEEVLVGWLVNQGFRLVFVLRSSADRDELEAHIFADAQNRVLSLPVGFDPEVPFCIL